MENRWKRSGGNEDLYRSIVDLGEGPKLANLQARYRGPDHPLVDEADIRLWSWGGEPASTLQAEWSRGEDYEAVINYRRFAYFNRIPSVANPSPEFAGATQQWLDIDRGLLDAEITARPTARIVPFFAFSRDSGKGPGKTTFVQDANEFSVSSATDTYTNTFMGGIRLRFGRWTGSIEGGTSAFGDSQALSFSGDSAGNRQALFFGRRLRLEDLEQSYRIRGSNRFARVRVEARTWDTLILFGQFAFSQPAVTLDYSETSSGEFVLLETLAAYTGESALAVGNAKRPRPSGNAGVEWRPTRRLRVVESVGFERFHASGTSESQRELFGTGDLALTENDGSRLESDLTRHQFDLTFELNRTFDLHGSHTDLTANAQSPGSMLAAGESRSYTRHRTGAGLTVRPLDRLDVRADVEFLRGDNVYFRTDDRDYERVALRGRYRITGALTATLYGSLWNNSNDLSDSAIVDDRLEQRSRNLGAELAYAPEIDWLGAVHASYERSTFASDVGFLIPQNFQSAASAYRERGHASTLTALIRPASRIEVDLEGQLFVSTDESDSGTRTRPTRFYDAEIRLRVEVIPRLTWNGDWRWVDYTNRALRSEAFGAHLIATGLTYVF